MQLQLKNNARSTAVPNRFIECCADAPDKYAAVYLLGFMYAANHQDIDRDILCARLGLPWDEVLIAFEYWQKKGFARIINGEQFSFEFGEFTREPAGEELYTEREFNQRLQELFGSRQLSPHEYLKIYDYTDIFRLPKKVVLCLAQYCILLKGRRVSVAYIDKVAQSWAEEEHIDTEQKALDKIASLKEAASGVLRVLTQLGITSRGPTQDESALFARWTREWGFTLEAILTACAHTTAAREPSMKYLDRILERLHDDGSLSSRQIAEKKVQTESASKDIQELLRIIGETGKPTFEHESLYRKWTSVFGYDMDMLSAAAKLLAARGRLPFPYLDEILTDWYNNRVQSPGEAQKAIEAQKALDKQIHAVLAATGKPSAITDAHRRAYLKWNGEWGVSHEAILLAAEISMLADNPYRYLNSKLSSWHSAGVKTLADAQRETKKHSLERIQTAKSGYFDRPTENYDHLAVNLFDDEGA
jgi:Putative primosome component and related proteins